MEFKEIHITEYDSFFNDTDWLFLKASYYLTNTPKENIHNLKCFIGSFNETNIGIIGLLENEEFTSPYRAPFGGFRTLNTSFSYNKMQLFYKELEKVLQNYGCKKIVISLPPLEYNQDFVSKQITCLNNSDFELINSELNQFFDLHKFNDNLNYLSVTEKQKTRYVLKKKLTHELVIDSKQKEEVYDLIKNSRLIRDIPLKLSWPQLRHITMNINADYWLVKTPNNENCASAVIYHINPEIVLIVYWGFDPKHYKLDSMRYLSYEIFKYYHSKDKKLVDIGISTENSIANTGLINFKESVGCDSCLRIEMSKKLIIS